MGPKAGTEASRNSDVNILSRADPSAKRDVLSIISSEELELNDPAEAWSKSKQLLRSGPSSQAKLTSPGPLAEHLDEDTL